VGASRSLSSHSTAPRLLAPAVPAAAKTSLNLLPTASHFPQLRPFGSRPPGGVLTFLPGRGVHGKLIQMWPISTCVNKPENDDPSIVEPVELTNDAS
jgi:hypothetical protein